METIWSHISVAVVGGLSLYSFATEYLRQCVVTYCRHPMEPIPFRPLPYACISLVHLALMKKRKWQTVNNDVDLPFQTLKYTTFISI